jgi:hypothetical protein
MNQGSSAMKKRWEIISCGGAEHGRVMLACTMKMIVPSNIKPPHPVDTIIEFYFSKTCLPSKLLGHRT